MSTLQANARQLVEDCNGQTVTVSAIEQNRLSVEGRRILSIVPPAKGTLISVADEDTGAAYFAPANATAGTITVFINDDQGSTCTLKLKPIATSAQDIVIKPVEKNSSKKLTSDGRASSYQRRVKDLVLVMADDELKDKGDITKVNEDIPLWKEGKLVLLSKHRDGDLVGEAYRLTNISPSDMLLVEQELYRRGVIAVSIEHHTLPPGQSTSIWVVRGRKDNE